MEAERLGPDRTSPNLARAGRIEQFFGAILKELHHLEITRVIGIRDSHRGQTPFILHVRIERYVVRLDGERSRMAKHRQSPRVLFSQHTFVFAAPSRRVWRQSTNRKSERVLNEPRIQSAASVKAAFRIAVVEMVNYPADRHAFELVQLLLEDRACVSVAVEHKILADLAARVRKSVRKFRG